VLLALVSLGAAVVVELMGFGSLAQTTAVLAAVLAGCAVAGWLWPQVPVVGAVPALAVLLPGLMFAMYFRVSSDVFPAAAYLLVLAAPLLLAATVLPPLGRLSPGRRALVRTAAVLAPLAAAVALAAVA
jgi:hypothetical protein